MRPKKQAGLEDDTVRDGDGLGIGAADSDFDLPGFIEAAARAAGLSAEDDAEDDEDDNDVAEEPTATETPGAPGNGAAAEMRNLGPMEFLRVVMRHPNTPLHLRVHVASILAPYLHPKPMASEQAFEIEDQYGFAVDRAVAKRIRDLTVALKLGLRHPMSFGARSRAEADVWLRKNLRQRNHHCSCPDGYRYQDREQDHWRLHEFLQNRKARIKLTPQEDAEEIHLTARALPYENGTDHAKREALRGRDEAEREASCIRWTVAARGDVLIGHGALDQAAKSWPDQRFTLRNGIPVIREHDPGRIKPGG